jgi:hypothetical protein
VRRRRFSSAIVTLSIVPILGGLLGSPQPGGAASLAGVKLINYFPSIHPWTAMWTHWDPTLIDHDFAEIEGLNANTVRLVIQPTPFGYPTPYAAMMDRLASAVRMANAHGLRVQLTLFDQWRSYTDLDGSRRWANAVLAPFRYDKRIESVELQNEIDPSNPVAIYWARYMLPQLRIMAGNIPITISSLASTSNLQKLKAGLGKVQPDFYSFHYYGSADNAVGILREARNIAYPHALFVGETGMPSGDGSPNTAPDPSQEAAQAHFISAVEGATQSLSLPPAAPWIYQDFAAGSLLPSSADTEYHYGLFRADGSEKPVATWLRSYFQARN